MATYVDQGHYDWGPDKVSCQDDSLEVSASQVLDHGSISFGRFAPESLSWEKRSVFSRNRCQEELEKFNTPGLVAKRKAYLEEHFKRIRAVKGSQENQQTELTSGCGGDVSISIKACDRVDAHIEETLAEIPAENEILEVQNELSDYGTPASNLDSLRSNAEDLDQEADIKHPLCSEGLLYEISTEQVKENIEVQNGNSDPEVLATNLDSSRIKSANLELDRLDDDTMFPLQMQQLDTITRGFKLLAIAIDKGDLSIENTVTCIEPEGDPKATELELKPPRKVASATVMPHDRNRKAHVSVHKVKEPSLPAGKALISDYKTISNIKPSWRPKCTSKTTRKSRKMADSSKFSSDKVLRNVTIPRPFSLATDRRSAVHAGSREGLVKSDYRASTSKRTSPDIKKDTIKFQARSEKTIKISGAENRALATKRGHEEAMKLLPLDGKHISRRDRGAYEPEPRKARGYEETKKPLPLDRQHVSLKDKGAHVLEPRKARSVNLPPCSYCSSSDGTLKRNNGHLGEDVRKEDNHAQSRWSEPSQIGRKDTKPQYKELRSENKKILSSSTNGRNLHLWSSEQSLDPKIPRHKRPPWR